MATFKFGPVKAKSIYESNFTDMICEFCKRTKFIPIGETPLNETIIWCQYCGSYMTINIKFEAVYTYHASLHIPERPI